MEKTRKYSRKREAILDCIRATKTHPSADWVYTQLKPQIPDLSLGTVYRNLTMFKDEGTIVSLGVVGGQERFDGNVEPHIHFICQNCGAVLDVEIPYPMQTLERQVAEAVGGKVTGHRLSFRGLCPNCNH
jgi:Fur family peroxide stress response transcriptional regulator